MSIALHECHGVNNIFFGAFFYSYQDDFTLRQVGAYMTESYVLNVVKRIIWVISLQTYNPQNKEDLIFYC